MASSIDDDEQGQPKARQIYYLGILRVQEGQQAIELVCEKDLSSFGMFSKPGYEQGTSFSARTIAERTAKGQRQTIKESRYQINAYQTTSNFCVIMISEPGAKRMAQQAFLSKVVDSFKSSFTATEIKEKQPPFVWPELSKLRAEAVNVELSGMSAVQNELDQTKIALHKTIEKVLERGEKLDDLVAKSDELSVMSKGFYRTSKQQNSCCLVM